jgi:hypothetical protein
MMRKLHWLVCRLRIGAGLLFRQLGSAPQVFGHYKLLTLVSTVLRVRIYWVNAWVITSFAVSRVSAVGLGCISR